MSDQLRPDAEIGSALREALAMPHDGAFVTRLRALVRQRRARTWDEVLAGWFWHGVATAALAAVALAAGYTLLDGGATEAATEESVAVQLIDAQRPGTDVVLASMAGIR